MCCIPSVWFEFFNALFLRNTGVFLVGTLYSTIKKEQHLKYIFMWALYGSTENLIVMYFLSTLKYILHSKAAKLQMNFYSNPFIRHFILRDIYNGNRNVN